MKPQEALEALNERLGGEPLLQVGTVARGAKKDDPPEGRVLNLSGDATQRFRKIINDAVRAELDPLKWALKKLDPLYKPELGMEIEWVRLDEVPAVVQAVYGGSCIGRLLLARKTIARTSFATSPLLRN